MHQAETARERMIAAAAQLVRTRGAAASGFSDILAASGAPRGSIYHHFPGGKAELLVAMLDRVGQSRADRIEAAGLEAGSAPDLVRAIGAIFGDEPAQAGWTIGCPVAAIASESGAHPPAVQEAAARALAGWVNAGRQAFVNVGVAPDRATALAEGLISGIEGGLLLARALGSAAPYEAALAQAAAAAEA